MPNLVKILLLAKPYYRVVIFLATLILLGAILDLATPLLIKGVVDQLETQLTTGSSDLTRMYYLVTLMFISWIVNTSLTSISNRLGDYASSRIGKYLVEAFYKKILSLPQRFFDQELSGKIANQLTRGISSIADFLGAATNFILPAFLQSFFTLILLTYYSPLLGGLGLLLFPVYVWLSHISTMRWGKYEVEKNTLEDTYKGRLQEVVSNIKLVKASNAQPIEYNYTKTVTENINQIYDKQSTGYHWLNFLRNSFLELMLLVMMLYAFRATFSGTFSFGILVLVMQLISQLRRPLFAMSFILERLQRAEAGSKEYVEILNITDTEAIHFTNSKKTKLNPVAQNPTIRFKDVSFKYQDDEVLKHVTLDIHPNETVAIVGHSGAGKTTVINLLLKLYEPTSGKIYFNDVSYEMLSHEEVRQKFSLVFQENELFSTTVFDNVSYGLKNVSDKKVIEALKKAYAYDFVKDLPNGIHTTIGERGAKLSGGQKQRIQIARAFLHPASVLILDEATSSLDAKSEYIIHEAIDSLAKEKTLIIIAHRFSTLQNADRIIVIDKGKIADSGKPQELAKRTGIYSELLRYQIEGNQKLLSRFEITV